MGIIKELYEKAVDKTLPIEDNKEQPASVYNPERCPCEYGICDECSEG